MTFDDLAHDGLTGPAARYLDGLWGCGDLDALFTDHVQVTTPWPRAGRIKHRPAIDQAAIATLLAQAVDLVDVDPRRLHAGQPWVLRHHVAYYRRGQWERTGRTSADRHVALNQYPVVVPDHRGRLVIVSGHHRAAAALLAGAPLRMRIAARGARAAVTPLLFVDETQPVDGSGAIDKIDSGRPATVGSLADAEVVLDELGLTALEIRSRLAMVRRPPVVAARQEGE